MTLKNRGMIQSFGQVWTALGVIALTGVGASSSLAGLIGAPFLAQNGYRAHTNTVSGASGNRWQSNVTSPIFSNFSTTIEQNRSSYIAFGGTQFGLQPGQLQVSFPAVSAGGAALMVIKNVNGVNFTGYGGTMVSIQNPANVAESISVWAVDNNNQSWRANITLPANSNQNYAFLNSTAPDGTQFGMQALPTLLPGYVNIFSTGSSSIDWSNIASIQVYSIGPQPAQTVNFTGISLLPALNLVQMLDGCSSRWGQSTLNANENPVSADSDLVNENTTEQQQLASGPLLSNIDKYGGSTSLPAQTATGAWQLAQVNGKWWFIDPLGNLYFMSGVDQINPTVNQTVVTGRNGMFQSLPASGDPLAANYGSVTINGQTNQTYNFYTQNLQLKYQTANWMQPWLTTTAKRLQNWGFNSYGVYSEWYENNTNSLPYVAGLSLTGNYLTIATGNNTNAALLPDPWDPAFKSTLQANMTNVMNAMKNDTYLVGLFTGIELGWTGPAGPNQNLGVAFGVMNTNASEPAHVQLVNQLQAEYKNVRYLNLYWGSHFKTFASVSYPVNYGGAVTPWMQADLNEFQQKFAAQFFSTCKGVIKAANPNLLYLGTEVGHYLPVMLQGAVGNVDAMCVNRYDTSIPMDVIGDAQKLNMPVMITESDFRSVESGMWAGPMVQLPTESARDQATVAYMNQALTTPNVIGVNWYQYMDQPLTGSLYGYPAGENFNEGLVDQTDTPYGPLIQAFKQFHLSMYSGRWNS